MNSVCFTGHRKIKVSISLIRSLYKTITMLINDGYTNFYAGGALGWDMLCERVVLKLKKKYPDIKLHLILPCHIEQQTLNWKENDIIIFKKIFNSADTIEFISENYYDGCMKKRNAKMIELSQCCLCFYNKNNYASGTGQTIRMAEKKNIKIINMFRN